MEHCIEITRVTHSAYAVDYQGERIGQGRSRHSAPGRTQDSKKMTAVMAAFSKQATHERYHPVIPLQDEV
jgi:hypothetical protein